MFNWFGAFLPLLHEVGAGFFYQLPVLHVDGNHKVRYQVAEKLRLEEEKRIRAEHRKHVHELKMQILRQQEIQEKNKAGGEGSLSEGVGTWAAG